MLLKSPLSEKIDLSRWKNRLRCEVALIGQPNSQWGEIPLALIVLKQGQQMT